MAIYYKTTGRLQFSELEDSLLLELPQDRTGLEKFEGTLEWLASMLTDKVLEALSVSAFTPRSVLLSLDVLETERLSLFAGLPRFQVAHRDDRTSPVAYRIRGRLVLITQLWLNKDMEGLLLAAISAGSPEALVELCRDVRDMWAVKRMLPGGSGYRSRIAMYQAIKEAYDGLPRK